MVLPRRRLQQAQGHPAREGNKRNCPGLYRPDGKSVYLVHYRGPKLENGPLHGAGKERRRAGRFHGQARENR